MKKKIIITALLALVAIAGQGQEIKMNEPSFSDYLPLLNAKGYMAYSFDTQCFSGKMAEPIVKEYVSGKEVGNLINFDISISLGEKLIVGFSPSENDSTANYIFQFTGGAFNASLMLRPIFNPSEPAIPIYNYESRPFELISPFKVGQFIPLVLYGSCWYDADSDVTRFCGEKFIKPDLSSDIIKYIPHFYVLGIKIK